MVARVNPRVDAAPEVLAARIVAAHAGSPEWLDSFEDAFAVGRGGELQRILLVWGMRPAEAAVLFGVSRQAVGKWLAGGVPPARAPEVADIAAATDILVRYVVRERIPAVVRRPADRLGGRSLVVIAAEEGTGAVLAACRAMFDFEGVQA